MRYDDRHRHRLRDLRDPLRGRSAAPSAGSPRKGLGMKVFWIVAVLGVAGLVVARPGCSADVVQPPAAKKPLAKLKPKDLQQQVTEWGIEGGAAAGVKALDANRKISTAGDAAPEPVVVPTDRGFVVKGVRSDSPYDLSRHRQQAERDALDQARRILVEQGKVAPGDWQLTYDPQKVREVGPSPEVKEAWEEAKLDADRGWVEIDEVTLTHEAVRKERAKGRTAEAGFWFGTVFLGLLAAYGFLRLDMWTKGYLTLALGLVVGGAVIAAVVALGMLVF